jgi:hypothetical protein
LPEIEIIASGHVTRDDAAFPTLVDLGDGELICGYTAQGQGPNALGGTEWSRSRDGGQSWIREGTILPRMEDPVRINSLRLSSVSDGTLLAYGSRDYLKGRGDTRSFGNERNEPVFCVSRDRGRSWSHPVVIPASLSPAYEISNPIVEVGSDVWLAPAATLGDSAKLGERVVVFESSDHGCTWTQQHTVFVDPRGEKGFFEQKIIRLGPDRLLAVAWTVTLGTYTDLENHFALSEDLGRTWTPPITTGIRGQTLSPLYLGGDRLLALSNRRYGAQGIVAYWVRFSEHGWQIEGQSTLWDARASRDRSTEATSGIDAFDDFAFGLPSAVRLEQNLFLAVHWCREDGIFGIRWTRFKEV